MTAADPDRAPAGEDVKPAEKADRKRGSSAHGTPFEATAAPGVPPRRPGAAVGRPLYPQVERSVFPPGRATPRPSHRSVFPPGTRRRWPDRRRMADAPVSAATTGDVSASRQAPSEHSTGRAVRAGRAATLTPIVPTAVLAFDFDPRAPARGWRRPLGDRRDRRRDLRGDRACRHRGPRSGLRLDDLLFVDPRDRPRRGRRRPARLRPAPPGVLRAPPPVASSTRASAASS